MDWENVLLNAFCPRIYSLSLLSQPSTVAQSQAGLCALKRYHSARIQCCLHVKWQQNSVHWSISREHTYLLWERAYLLRERVCLLSDQLFHIILLIRHKKINKSISKLYLLTNRTMDNHFNNNNKEDF